MKTPKIKTNVVREIDDRKTGSRARNGKRVVQREERRKSIGGPAKVGKGTMPDLRRPAGRRPADLRIGQILKT